jgi:hypothetical protein
MMRNENYDAEALAESVEVAAGLAKAQVDGLLASVAAGLRSHDGYAEDHAAEHLEWAAKRFEEVAKSLRSLRRYTAYPPGGTE